MAYELVLAYGIIAIIIGFVPAVAFTIWRFGFKRNFWYSWLLGGLFWSLALIIRAIPFMILMSIFGATRYTIYIITLLSGIFETVFRTLLFLLFTKFTADTKEKVIMAGLGWGTFEAIFGHTIPVLIFILFSRDSKLMLQLDGVEYIILLGGYNHLLNEIFHLMMMIMIFYGIKYKLKDIDVSEPICENFFSKDPRPAWIWIIIVAILQFTYGFLFIIFITFLGLYKAYILITVFIGILVSYILKRIKFYPLFPVKPED